MFFKTNIAVIGNRKSGKTAIINYLRDVPFSSEELPSDFFYTKQVQSSSFKLNINELSVDSFKQAKPSDWDRYIKDIDILIYCVDLTEVFSPGSSGPFQALNLEAFNLSAAKPNLTTFLLLTKYDQLSDQLHDNVEALKTQLSQSGFNYTLVTSAKPEPIIHLPSKGSAGIKKLKRKVYQHLEEQPVNYAISLLGEDYPELQKALKELHTALKHLPISERLRIENETVNMLQRFVKGDNAAKLAAIKYYRQTCTKILYENPDSSFRWRKWYSRVLVKILLITCFILSVALAGFAIGLAMGAQLTGPGALFVAAFGALLGALAGIYLATKLPFDQFLGKFSLFTPKEEAALDKVIKAATPEEEEDTEANDKEDLFSLV